MVNQKRIRKKKKYYKINSLKNLDFLFIKITNFPEVFTAFSFN